MSCVCASGFHGNGILQILAQRMSYSSLQVGSSKMLVLACCLRYMMAPSLHSLQHTCPAYHAQRVKTHHCLPPIRLFLLKKWASGQGAHEQLHLSANKLAIGLRWQVLRRFQYFSHACSTAPALPADYLDHSSPFQALFLRQCRDNGALLVSHLLPTVTCVSPIEEGAISMYRGRRPYTC